jgi:organic hydroperoxide reductase OsmC/OhrA
MASYHAKISWTRGVHEFSGQKYSRGHLWAFDEGVIIPASASPHTVKAPWAVVAAVDPEEALVAALSSCHMLFFLSYVSRDGFIAESYDDPAEGVLEKGPSGKVVMTRVTLRPAVTFSGKAPDKEQFDRWHHDAHEECYIANSVRSEVTVQASFVVR